MLFLLEERGSSRERASRRIWGQIRSKLVYLGVFNLIPSVVPSSLSLTFSLSVLEEVELFKNCQRRREGRGRGRRGGKPKEEREGEDIGTRNGKIGKSRVAWTDSCVSCLQVKQKFVLGLPATQTRRKELEQAWQPKKWCVVFGEGKVLQATAPLRPKKLMGWDGGR